MKIDHSTYDVGLDQSGPVPFQKKTNLLAGTGPVLKVFKFSNFIIDKQDNEIQVVP